MRSIVLSLALLISMVAIPPPAEATKGLYDEYITGAGWKTFVVRDPGPSVQVSASGNSDHPIVTGVHAYTLNGTHIGSSYSRTSGEGAMVALHEEGTGLSIDREARFSRPTIYTGSLAWLTSGEDVMFAVWVAGENVKWRLRVVTDNPLVMTDVVSGNETHYFDGSEFDGPLVASAQVGPAEAAVLHKTSRHVEVRNSFVGYYGVADVAHHDERPRIVGPRWERQCPCPFRNVTGPDAMSAGSYELRWSGVEVDTFHPVFAGADVRFGLLAVAADTR